jgi:hypothetical protein
MLMNIEFSPNLNTAICPLCGQPNHCVMAADPNAEECWCGDVEFPQELLDQVPEDAIRKTCICQACLENFNNLQGKIEVES